MLLSHRLRPTEARRQAAPYLGESMRRLPLWTLFALFALPVSPAMSVENGPNLSFSGDPQIFQFDYFVGPAWTCSGTSFDFKTGAPSSVAATWEFKYDCEHGMVVDTMTTSKEGAPFTVWGWNYYDAVTQTLVRNATDSDGTWANASTAGWDGSVWTWRGSMNTVANGPYQVSNTITTKAATLFWVDVIIRPVGHAKWFDGFKGTCRRNPPYGR